MCLLIIATVTLMVFFNALYVAAEFATVSSRRTKINQLAGQGNRLAQSLLPFLEDSKALDRYVAACQIGITISSLVLGAYGQNVLANGLDGPIASMLDRFPSVVSLLGGEAASATLVLARLHICRHRLICHHHLTSHHGGIFPKSVAIQFPERVAMAWYGHCVFL